MSYATRNRLAPVVLALGVCGLPAVAVADAFYANAKVTDVQPIVRVVRVATPQEVCWDEPVRRENRRHRSHVPAVLGGIIGGVVGNKFGSGRGQDAMTVAGALLGASVGRDAEYRQRAYGDTRYVSARRCEIEETVHEEERVEGYRVTYRYRGQDYVTRMPNAPGDRIRVRVRVEPVG